MRMRLALTCPACGHRELVETPTQAMARRDRHRAAFGDGHDVAFETVGEQPLFRGGVSDDWK